MNTNGHEAHRKTLLVSSRLSRRKRERPRLSKWAREVETLGTFERDRGDILTDTAANLSGALAQKREKSLACHELPMEESSASSARQSAGHVTTASSTARCLRSVRPDIAARLKVVRSSCLTGGPPHRRRKESELRENTSERGRGWLAPSGERQGQAAQTNAGAIREPPLY